MIRRNKLLVECTMAMVAGKKPPTSTIYLAQRQDGAPSSTTECFTRHRLDPSVSTKFNFSLKTHDPPDKKLVNHHGRSNILRMDLTRKAALFTPDTRTWRTYLTSPSSNLRQLQSGEYHAPSRKTPRRRSLEEEKQASRLVPCCLLPSFSRYDDV